MAERYNPNPEEQNVVLIGAETLRQAEELIAGCEGCCPEDTEIPFDSVLDRITGNNPAVTDYIFVEAMAKCPRCRREINEKTLVKLG